MDPAHFYTAPGLAWQALLKTAAEYYEHEKRRKECEVCPRRVQAYAAYRYRHAVDGVKGIRDGIIQGVKSYAKVNNKYMKDLCNPDEEGIYLQYLDASNLYGWAMVQNLPTHGFLWKDAEFFTPEKIDEHVKKEGISFGG